MNTAAILTPGGIADQLSRGLSGVAQAFTQRRQMQMQQQQQDFENNQSELRIALAQAAEERQSAAQALAQAQWEKQHDAQANQFSQELAAREREQQTQDLYRNPEAHVASPNPAYSRTAQGLVDRSRFMDATKGYVRPEDQKPLPGVDWRVGVSPGQPVLGPVPGSPAAQGLEVYTRSMQPKAESLSLEDHLTLQKARDDAAFKRQEEMLRSRELESARKQWAKDRQDALSKIYETWNIGSIGDAERDRLITAWNEANPEPGGGQASGQAPASPNDAARRAAWAATP